MPYEAPYIDRNKAMASYRPKGYGISPGLRRARRPFILVNLLTGSLISLFAVGVWAYSIRAVRQDVFDDVDEEAKALTKEMKMAVQTVEEKGRLVEEKLKVIANERTTKSLASSMKAAVAANAKATASGSERRGVMPLLGMHNPGWVYDPSKSLVWGAPPVDNMGRIGDRTTKD
ncbi:hypothetical protein M408DRAFT_333154 [Serendipita vermifera MAFF 305830]|uniref:Cytochrome c oxidase assembly factor 3 n=1 Tax=Serendipita vermifera MAFF 305830 TaxID=933852 RepID=A0A0C2WX52_SERVB|nr:hypothetical protein M408DRAFT_333154 [Serendipita vermifera MAFF 305830]